jgi:hypothetical protein
MAKAKEYKHNSHPQYLHVTKRFTKECRKEISCFGPVTIFSSSKYAGNLQFKAIWLLPHSVFVSAREVERNWNLKEDQKTGLIKHPNC